jgi:hypothetical protein
MLEFAKMDRHVCKMTEAMVVMVDHFREERLAMGSIGCIQDQLTGVKRCSSTLGVHKGSDLWALVVWHVLWFHWQGGRGGEFLV